MLTSGIQLSELCSYILILCIFHFQLLPSAFFSGGFATKWEQILGSIPVRQLNIKYIQPNYLPFSAASVLLFLLKTFLEIFALAEENKFKRKIKYANKSLLIIIFSVTVCLIVVVHALILKWTYSELNELTKTSCSETGDSSTHVHQTFWSFPFFHLFSP